jgi:RNA polymerase sigma-70 factor (ECF subfamily)
MDETQTDSPSASPDPATWVDRHGDVLFRFALSRLGSRSAAEDLVQETFLAALRSGRTFAGRSTERTWFVGILKHKIVDYLRQHGRERPVSALNCSNEMDEELFDNKGWWQIRPGKWPADPSDALESNEFWESFRRCLDGLPQRLRTVFALREIDELSTAEVCQGLKVTPGNLGVLLYRARMGLRRCLEINWFGGETGEG